MRTQPPVQVIEESRKSPSETISEQLGSSQDGFIAHWLEVRISRQGESCQSERRDFSVRLPWMLAVSNRVTCMMG